MSANPKLPRSLVIFTVTYFGIACAYTFLCGKHEFIFYGVVMVVLMAAILAVHLRCQLPAPLLWALSIWGLTHLAGGLVPLPSGWPYHGSFAVLYSLWLIPEHLKYDQVVHAYGFGITTWLCWVALRAAIESRTQQPLRPTFGLMVLCAAAGMGFGALNEVIEFVATLTLPDTNVGGYLNTGWDLVYNTLGASAASLLILWRHPRSPRPPAR